MTDKPPITEPVSEVSEAEVRRLRDNVYGPTSDDGWRACGPNWQKPENIQWLRSRPANQQPKPKP